MAQILEFTHSIRTPCLAKKANIVVPEVVHTCTTGRGRVIDFALISTTLECNSTCKPHIGTCLQFTASPTQVRVRQACFPKTFAFPKTVDEVVLSRKRMKSKTKPEEPIRKRSNSCAWPSKTRAGHPKVVSQSIWFTARNEAHGLGILI